MSWHEQADRPEYLFKLRLTKNLKRAMARLKEEDWEGCHNFGVLQTAELDLQLSGWTNARRVVVGRRLMGHTGGEDDGEFWSYAKYEYEAYNTWNLFLRLMEPDRHVEAEHGRRWFLFISARLVKSSRQRTWKMAICGHWRADLMQGYRRVLAWLNLTAPQLQSIQANAPPKHAQIISI